MTILPNRVKTRQDVRDALWTRAGRSTVGFVRISRDYPASLGSGTLIKFGDVVGILTCAHVLEEQVKEAEIGILCCTVRANQTQSLRLSMETTDHIIIGSSPWVECGPDLGFLRLPLPIIGAIERFATIVSGDLHRENIVLSEPERTLQLFALSGFVDELTKSPIITKYDKNIGIMVSFEEMINIGHVHVDDKNTDRFRFQPVASLGENLPSSYKGTSGGGLWQFFLNQDDFSVVQVRLAGVAYFEKKVEDELHIIGHAQISIYDRLFNAIREKWPTSYARANI